MCPTQCYRSVHFQLRCVSRGWTERTYAGRLEEVEAAVAEVVVAPQAGDNGSVGREGGLDDFAAEEV